MRFTNILLVLDSDSDHSSALRRSIALTRNQSATLTVCAVVDSMPASYRRVVTALTEHKLIESIVADKREQLAQLIQSIDVKGLSINITVLTGKPHIEIAKQVEANHHDLVVKSIAGRRSKLSFSAKREDRQLMRTCPCPVWLMGTGEQTENGCIVAALEMPAKGSTNDRLNEQILEVAMSIALAEFRPLHVVHAWHLMGEGHMRARGTEETELAVDRMITGEAFTRTNWLRNTIEATRSDSHRVATDFLDPQLHVVKGYPDQVVTNLADDLGASLIVMGTAARAGISGVWPGNTSEKILFGSNHSVLIVRQSDTQVVVEATERAQAPSDDAQIKPNRQGAIHRRRHRNLATQRLGNLQRSTVYQPPLLYGVRI